MGCLKIPYPEKNAKNSLRVAYRNFANSPEKRSKYYPFGLSMAGISSKAAGSLENRYKFNKGTELNNDFDLSFYETQCRLYDPQIGRFWQVDEIAEVSWEWTPYNFALNNPISLNDPSGLVDEKPEEPKEKSTKEKPKDLKKVVVRSYKHSQMTSLYWMLRNKGIGFDRVNNDKLRERLENWDKTQRGLERYHKGVKEDGMVMLEIGSFFIPTAWITKLKYVKTAVNLFKFKRGVAAVKTVRKAMTTVLGKMGRESVQGYEKIAAQMEYNSFQLSERYSEKELANMTEKEIWSANMKFLDEAVAAGDEIVLSQRINSLDQVTHGSGLWKELKHLIDAHGFHFSADGTKMIR